MEWITKPDGELAAQQWTRFWAGEADGPLLAATVLRDGATPVAKPSAYTLGPDLEVDLFCDGLLAWAEAYEFLGAALPFVYLEFAADQFATFLGGELVFPTAGEGGWSTHPLAHAELATVDLRFLREGPWWRKYTALCEQMRDRLAGRVMIAAPTFVANLDALVALRGGAAGAGRSGGSAAAVERAWRRSPAATASSWTLSPSPRRAGLGQHQPPRDVQPAAHQRAAVRLLLHDLPGHVPALRGAVPGDRVRALRRR